MAPAANPILLLVLDGFGYREDKAYNAIAEARMSTYQTLWDHCPHTTLLASGHVVGLPDQQMGNSEVGHMHIGAGRVINQDLTRIDQAIADGTFESIPLLHDTLQKAAKEKRTIHVMGLLSKGGVHSHERHIQALLQAMKDEGCTDVKLHCFLDGRDTPPKSAGASLAALQATCDAFQFCSIASIIGRYYAMDRDRRYERIQCAYDLLIGDTAPYTYHSAKQALEAAYARGETDEFVQATRITLDPASRKGISENDIVIFMNFRADRARELTHALTDSTWNGFERKPLPPSLSFITLTQYDMRLNLPVIFPQETHHNLLGEYLSTHGFRQLRIAETEKYAHVTFFFDGGKETTLPHEDRILIPSPKIATYDLQPEMSAPLITDALINAMMGKRYDVIICNFANPDMVGHTGDYQATITALEALDACLGQLVNTAKANGYEIIITADHGNAECMYDTTTEQPHTAHTTEPVPFIYMGRPAKIVKNNGTLADIAPTLLYLMQLPIPSEMTGTPLVSLISS